MSLWAWALEAYARPGAAEACLDLQDRHGQCAPLAIWAAWAAGAGRWPDAAGLSAAVAAARSWNAAAVEPLRGVRRRIKAPVPPVADAAREALREQVKTVELAAERLLLETLEALTPPAGARPSPAEALEAACAAWSGAAPHAACAELARRLYPA